ncbi:MAG: hypothetical protein LBK06_05310, partial [Planctomycetaceae bacterium]|nr:hypothetical protein [Planctomycetaceae bacterium]
MRQNTTSKRMFGTFAVLLGFSVALASVILSDNVFAQVAPYPAPNHQIFPAAPAPATHAPSNIGSMPANNPVAAPPMINASPVAAPPMINTPPIAASPVYAPAAQPLSIEQARDLSTQKLYAARCAVASRDFVQAERLAVEVQGLRVPYQQNEDRPEAIIGLIRQQNALDESLRANGGVVTDQFKRGYALLLLSQANALLHYYSDVELAAKLNNVAIAQNVLYSELDNRNGLSPQAVTKRIADIRNYRSALAAQNSNRTATPIPNQPQPNQQLSLTTQRQLNNAILILKTAREAINNGDLERARNLCANVQNMQLPDSLFPLYVETPTKLLGEIAVHAQSVNQPAAYPPTTLRVPNNTANNTANNNNANNTTNNIANNTANNTGAVVPANVNVA